MKFRPISPARFSRSSAIRAWAALCPVAVGLISGCSSVNPTTTVPVSSKHPVKHGDSTFPQFIADPLEPVNRGLWGVNHGILVGFMQPTGKVYRAIVPTPARRSINNFTRNITYPTRLVNNALQGRWSGAGDESLRFLCNTTAGIGGLFDVATKWNIPKSDADFGQTFVRWGWKPGTYLMLPVLGPSDETHALGLAADEASEPWNYAEPYIYASYGTSYNKLTDQTEDAVQFVHTEADPYVGVKNIWTYVSKDGQPNWDAPGPKDPGTLQTLGVALIKPTDPNFLQNSRVMSVRMSSTGRKMKFNYWLQKTHAPLVYISPGQGLHRESSTTLALAEMIYQSGYSVVTTTGVFHPEFMENASTRDLPAYPPTDCHDLLTEFTDFDRVLEKKHPGLFGKRALVGFSMGGFQALYLAAHDKEAAPDMVHFDRYVAIDTPVDLRVGYKSIDACYDATEAWPAAERQEKVNNAIHKVASLVTLPAAPTATPPFNAIESKFLIGMSFKLTLRDTIFSSQMRHDMGVLQTPLSKWRRDASYDEILRYSFDDYFVRFVLPYYKDKGVGAEDFAREVDLRSYQNRLGADSRIRVLVNKNDFILHPNDISWLKSTFPQSRLSIFPNGGHLGNLTTEPVKQKILGSLDGLK
ncbi:MAG: MlaA family lipoprotein [Luteolibacter sp.]|uniref:MlaA family lipoprotein n=1 Tax=Luteolibacter sp. TaxID=1962973 RepID=UPI00326342A1